jgi:hypothetical protein
MKSKCDCQQIRCKCYKPEETLAAQALFNELTSITVTLDVIVHIGDAGNLRVFSIMSKLPLQNNAGEYVVVSPETEEIYVFNHYGQHKHTVNIMTDQFMYNFTYNVNSFYGKLEQILDDAGNKIEIKRNYAMHAKEIISPDMSKYEFIMDNMDHLQTFPSPDNSTAIFKYAESSELLTSKSYMPTLERLKAVEGLGFATQPPQKIVFQKDAKWCILLHFGYEICSVKSLNIV